MLSSVVWLMLDPHRVASNGQCKKNQIVKRLKLSFCMTLPRHAEKSNDRSRRSATPPANAKSSGTTQAFRKPDALLSLGVVAGGG
jgi:hypothetical protein